jgi:hypothetical protein
MAAISQSQSCHDESHHSPAQSTIPATQKHSPDPKLHKQSNIWDLKDPAHPLYQHGKQKAYEKWLDQAREEADDSPKCLSPSTNPRSPGLEDISKEEKNPYPFTFHEIMPPKRHLLIAEPSNMPGTFNPTEPRDP